MWCKCRDQVFSFEFGEVSPWPGLGLGLHLISENQKPSSQPARWTENKMEHSQWWSAMSLATNRWWCKKIVFSDLECFKNWHFQDIIFPAAQIHCCHIAIVTISIIKKLKLIHIKFREWQKMCFSFHIESIFGLSAQFILVSPCPGSSTQHSGPAPVAEHAPCSQPEKLVPGPGAQGAQGRARYQSRHAPRAGQHHF